MPQHRAAGRGCERPDAPALSERVDAACRSDPVGGCIDQERTTAAAKAMSDDAKNAILARRAKFVAAALAGITMACGKENAPHPCLDVPPPEDAATIQPMTCLTTTAPPPSAPPPDAGVARPCLEVMPPKAKPKGSP